MREFTGFPKETFDWLGELAEQNNREWFTANRARYEAYCLGYFKAASPINGWLAEVLRPGHRWWRAAATRRNRR